MTHMAKPKMNLLGCTNNTLQLDIKAHHSAKAYVCFLGPSMIFQIQHRKQRQQDIDWFWKQLQGILLLMAQYLPLHIFPHEYGTCYALAYST